MQLSLAFVLGLLVQQSLQIDGFGGQSGNLFSLGGGAAVAKPAGPLFTNVGNVNLNSLQSGFGAAASPGFLGGAGGGGIPGLQGGGAYNPAFGGAGGFGQKLGYAGGFGQKQGFGGGFGLGGGHGFGGGHAFGGGHGLGGIGSSLLGGFGGPRGFQGGLPFGFGHPAGHAGKKEVPLKLTCQNVDHKKTEYSYNEASIAATIMKTRDGEGSYGDFSAGYGKQKMSLSLDLTVKINGGKGPAKAKVVFTKTAATSYGCDPYSLGGVFTGDNKADPFSNLFGGGSFFGGGYNDHDDGVVTTLSIYPDQTTSVHKDKLKIDSLEHLAGRGLAIVTGVKKDAYGKNEIDGNVLACCALAYDDQPRSLNDGPKHPIGYDDEPKHPIGYDGPKQPIGYDGPPRPIGYDDPKHPIGYDDPKHPIGYDGPPHPIGYDDKPYDPRFDGPRRSGPPPY
ncbi:uncharacterized PE-PGRS family protein PE_PGRS10-like isoform X2 [Littorina saxatilis]|uniref:uncharacterized PE-PGRS family protein PE_PGRS10-like isoform X2 n=1 Tax=Littorina saxatilis TaxID=31220 RepID=UPI0038B69C9E